MSECDLPKTTYSIHKLDKPLDSVDADISKFISEISKQYHATLDAEVLTLAEKLLGRKIDRLCKMDIELAADEIRELGYCLEIDNTLWDFSEEAADVAKFKRDIRIRFRRMSDDA